MYVYIPPLFPTPILPPGPSDGSLLLRPRGQAPPFQAPPWRRRLELTVLAPTPDRCIYTYMYIYSAD